jgi:hypothetical protein
MSISRLLVSSTTFRFQIRDEAPSLDNGGVYLLPEGRCGRIICFAQNSTELAATGCHRGVMICRTAEKPAVPRISTKNSVFSFPRGAC